MVNCISSVSSPLRREGAGQRIADGLPDERDHEGQLTHPSQIRTQVISAISQKAPAKDGQSRVAQRMTPESACAPRIGLAIIRFSMKLNGKMAESGKQHEGKKGVTGGDRGRETGELLGRQELVGGDVEHSRIANSKAMAG